MEWVALIFYLFIGFLFLFQVVFRVARRWLKFPTPGIMTQLIDNPFRRRFIQSPDTIADRMELKPGMKAVEVGPGKGSYTFAVARRVAPGTVYACDIQPTVVERLKERAAREGVLNVDARVEDAYCFSFSEDSVDRGLMIACLPEIPDPVRALRECRRVLKPGGLLSTCELLMDPDYPLMGTERRWAAEAGLEPYREYPGLLSYQMVFRKPTP